MSILVALPTPGGGEPEPTTDSATGPDGEGTTEIFNGRDLEGWTTWLRGRGHDDPEDTFSVVDGLLRISGSGFGYLATDRTWDDYDLVVEWRWGSAEHPTRAGKARDSGVFVHARGPPGNSHDGDGAFMAGIEVNLFEGASGDILLIRGDDPAGKLIAPRVEARMSEETDDEGFRWWRPSDSSPLQALETWGRLNWRWKSPDWTDRRGYRGERDVEQPAGEWNRLEIHASSGTIKVTMNGTTVNQVSNVRPQSGRILLQCEGAEIFFRRVAVREHPRRALDEPQSRSQSRNGPAPMTSTDQATPPARKRVRSPSHPARRRCQLAGGGTVLSL